jgi:Protein of unknown function (DUF3175)
MGRQARTATRPTRVARGRKWSAEVTRRSNALDLEPSVFRKGPRAIAFSLKRSADRSRRRKATPYASAMSMLTFYINRAGRGLRATRKGELERAKDELRWLYGRAPRRRSPAAARSQRAGRRRARAR